MKPAITLSLLCLFFLCNTITAQTIQTLAGGNGDSGPATAAEIGTASSVAADKFGNVYIANAATFSIRKVSPSGVISAFAGRGISGYSVSENGHSALSAHINVDDIACDTAGNVYITDATHGVIRKVDASGVITTFAGGGSATAEGIAATNSSLSYPSAIAADNRGNLYISASLDHKVKKVDAAGNLYTVAGTIAGFSGDTGAATAARMNRPNYLTVDKDGNLYILDANNYRIRKVDTAGIITTYAGSGLVGYAGDGGPATAAQFNGVKGLCTDTLGNLYIADNGNNLIRRVNAAGIISRAAGRYLAGSFAGDGGLDTAARLNSPYGVAGDKNGNYYVCDYNNDRIRKVNAAHIISTYAGNGGASTQGYRGDGGPGISALLNGPSSIAVDTSRNIYIADRTNRVVRKLAPSGIITTIAGTGSSSSSGDGGPATSANITTPNSVTTDRRGNIYVCDQNYNCIRRINSAGIISKFAGTSTLGFSGDGGSATAAKLDHPSIFLQAKNGAFYVVDNNNFRIRKIDSNGTITTIAGTGISGFFGDGGQATDAQITGPGGMAIDDAGNIYITVSYRIRKISTSGIISTICGNGTSGSAGDGGPASAAQLGGSAGLAFDKKGKLLICDGIRIRAIDTAGIITTIAGGNAGDFGDGFLALQAGIASPNSLAVDSLGNILLTETGDSRLRIIYNTRAFITSTVDTSCFGSPVTLRVTITGVTGFTPSYQWKRNGVNVGTDSAAWTTSTLHDTDQITCVVSNGSGGSIMTYAETFIAHVRSYAPSVSISNNPSSRVCVGVPVVCTAVPVSGGSSPTYDWYKNSILVTGTDTTYHFIPMDGDIVTCRLHSNMSCRLYDTVTSARDSFVVRDTLSPGVYIVSTPGTIVCRGATAFCTATAIIGGSTPHYDWFKNSALIAGVTGPEYMFVPANGDAVHCRLHSSSACLTRDTVSSNVETFIVKDSVYPAVDMTTTTGDSFCSGSLVECVALPVSSSSTSVITWFWNGTPSGTSALFSCTPANGDEIYCIMRNNGMCATKDTVYSPVHTLISVPVVTPTVTIPIDIMTVKPGTEVTLTATSTFGGSNPVYKWFTGLGGLSHIGPEYKFTPQQSDWYVCELLSDAACATEDSVYSGYEEVRIDLSIPSGEGIYPNPNTGSFKLIHSVYGPDGTDVGMTIYAMSGQLMYKETLIVAGNSVSADVSMDRVLPEGIYMIQLACLTGTVGIYFVVRY